MSSQQTFKRKFTLRNRLTNSKDFDSVFDNKEIKISTPSLLVLAKRNNYKRNRLGMIVSKKSVPKSIQRNKTKRHIRETFRNISTDEEETMDIVVVTRPKIRKEQNPLKLIQESFESLVSEFGTSKSA